ncbi:MAG: hypothetical protein ACHQKZ_00525 [Solirubrobacterales bacterium]
MTRRAVAFAAVASLALASLVATDPALAQCAMCKATVAQSPEGRAMADTLNSAILVMFVAPYLVFGTIAAVVFRARLVPFLLRVLRFLLLPR